MDKVRRFLERNKIYFETIAATLLSIMALVVSCSQTEIARKQTALSEKQTLLLEKQLERESRVELFNWIDRTRPEPMPENRAADV